VPIWKIQKTTFVTLIYFTAALVAQIEVKLKRFWLYAKTSKDLLTSPYYPLSNTSTHSLSSHNV